MNWIALLLLIPAIVAYAIKELQSHSKLKWSKGDDSFWGEESYWRKYANPLDAPPNNWYTSFFVLKYRERFPFSSTFLVFLTDGMHLMQFLFFLFLSLSISVAIGFTWWTFIWVSACIRIVHFITYRFLQR